MVVRPSVSRGAEWVRFPALEDSWVCIRPKVSAAQLPRLKSVVHRNCFKTQHIVVAKMSVFKNKGLVRSVKFPRVCCLFQCIFRLGWLKLYTN